MFSLSGRNAVVTGAASGIGAAIARRFYAAGARVLAADIAPAGPVDWPGDYRRTDVTDAAQVAALLDDAITRYGSLDILVNNAGIAVTGDIANIGSDAAERMFRINTMGVLYGMREAATRMGSGGAIVNLASIAATVGIPGLVEYSMGKAAVLQATKVAALDLGARNIRVNAICPGVIVTPLSVNADAPLVALAPHISALGRAGEPEEVAALAHFLASSDASYITGQAMFVDGGWNIGLTMQEIVAGLGAAGAA